MSIKIDYRMEFERFKKTIAVQGVLGGSGSVTIIDKRLPAKYKKDFDSLQLALDAFFEPSQILPICKRYFAAVQTGGDLLGVVWPCCIL